MKILRFQMQCFLNGDESFTNSSVETAAVFEVCASFQKY